MKRLSPAFFLYPFFLAACLLPLQAAGETAAVAADPEPPGYQSAKSCARCHPESYRTWRASRHASSFTGPAFQLPYDRLRRENPRRTFSCEQCHNPIRFLLAPDESPAAVVAQEGVTCDFCHSVESVNLTGAIPEFRAVPGVKFGPRGGQRRESPHLTRFSRLHITSEFCGGCHEYKNALGVAILSTYSEWAASFYRGEGVHCQFCHLPQLFDARFIEPKGKTNSPLDHSMVAGRSRERLARAIPVRTSLKVYGNEARLRIQVKNELVGHKTPNGIPTHRIRMVSTLFDASGSALGIKEEVFERVVGDGTGKPITRPERIFTAAREVLKDNRIRPKETREILQVFPIGARRPATAEVALTYEMNPPDPSPGQRGIEIPFARVIARATTGFRALHLSLAALAAALLLFLAAYYGIRRLRKEGRA